MKEKKNLTGKSKHIVNVVDQLPIKARMKVKRQKQ